MIKKAWSDLEDKLIDYPNRIKHTKGVVESVIKLSKNYNIYKDDLVVAAIYHDYFKYDDISNLNEYISFCNRVKFKKHPYVYHAYAAYNYVGRLHKEVEKKSLLAIKHHVLGRPNMTMEEKILFVSDYLDGNREFIDYKEVMTLALKDIDKAVLYCLEQTINYLKEKNNKLHIRQIMSYNYYKKEVIKWN